MIGRPFDEETLLRVAYAFEQQTDHHRRKPSL
jgi:aspartyl-tRNA(Asn)/glutamyl-tRNA(Gln) amidotransferase subunit A